MRKKKKAMLAHTHIYTRCRINNPFLRMLFRFSLLVRMSFSSFFSTPFLPLAVSFLQCSFFACFILLMLPFFVFFSPIPCIWKLPSLRVLVHVSVLVCVYVAVSSIIVSCGCYTLQVSKWEVANDAPLLSSLCPLHASCPFDE